jgi:predicted DNA-binding transcriptional regulator AlpA
MSGSYTAGAAMRTPIQIIKKDLTAVDRKRLVRAAEAARLRGTSEDTVRRQLAKKAIKLGRRSVGYRLEDVLALSEQ